MRTQIFLLLALASAGHAADPDPSLPHLRRQGTATQLLVGGKPFLVRGGELGNSTATNAAYLAPFWSKFADLTSPVYVLVGGQPGRASADDICYLRRWVGYLEDLVTSRRLYQYESELAALAAYGEAVQELQRRFVEAGGGVCTHHHIQETRGALAK